MTHILSTGEIIEFYNLVISEPIPMVIRVPVPCDSEGRPLDDSLECLAEAIKEAIEYYSCVQFDPHFQIDGPSDRPAALN